MRQVFVEAVPRAGVLEANRRMVFEVLGFGFVVVPWLGRNWGSVQPEGEDLLGFVSFQTLDAADRYGRTWLKQRRFQKVGIFRKDDVDMFPGPEWVIQPGAVPVRTLP